MNCHLSQKIWMNVKQLLSPDIIASLIVLFIYFTAIQILDVISTTVTMIGDIAMVIAMML